jgi:Fe-S cluster assembly protein SufB
MNATLTPEHELDDTTLQAVDIDRTAGDFSYPENHTYDAGVGLSEATIDYICDVKNDPDWVRDFRKRALKVFWKNRCPPTGRRRIWKTSTSARSVIT